MGEFSLPLLTGITKERMKSKDNLRLLFGEICKGKSLHKAEKVLIKLKDLSSFQQNINFVFGKSMQHRLPLCSGFQHNPSVSSFIPGIPQSQTEYLVFTQEQPSSPLSFLP